MRMPRMFTLAVVTALGLAACTSDPTTTEEYQQLAADKAEIETQLTEAQTNLETTKADLEESEGLVDEMRPQLSTLESEKVSAEDRVGELTDELDAWKMFTGSPNEEPYLWSQELFDMSIVVCTTDGTSESDCVCVTNGLESQTALMDLMFFTEITAAAELGAVPINPITDLPDGLSGEFVGLITEIVFDCLG